MPDTARTSTSMSLDRSILDEARGLGINLSRAAEQGLVAAIRAERARLQSGLAASRTATASPQLPAAAHTEALASTPATAPVAAAAATLSAAPSPAAVPADKAPAEASAPAPAPAPAPLIADPASKAAIQAELSDLERELIDRACAEPAGTRSSHSTDDSGVASVSAYDFDFSDDEAEAAEAGNRSAFGLVEAFDDESREELARLVARNTTINSISRVRILQRKPKVSKSSIVAARLARANAARNSAAKVRWASIVAHETSLNSTPTPKISTPPSRLRTRPSQFPHKDSAPSPVFIQRYYGY